jgi:hypothetical protein
MARTVDMGTETRLGIRVQRLERVAGESLDEIRDLARQLTPASGGNR